MVRLMLKVAALINPSLELPSISKSLVASLRAFKGALASKTRGE